MTKPLNRTRLLLLVTLILLVISLMAIVVLIIILQTSKSKNKESFPSSTPQISLASETPTVSLETTSSPTAGKIASPSATGTNPANSDATVFILSMKDGKYNHLFVYHPEFLTPTRLTSSAWDDIDPAVSPDETKLAFSSRRSGFWDIYVMDLTTGEITQVTNSNEYDGHPTWSNDGQWLAFETYAEDRFEINIISLTNAGDPPILLTDDAGNNHSPSWSPLGREIAFVSDRSGDQDIWLARLDNVDDRFVNVSNAPGSSECDPSWSPEGEVLAWTSNASGEFQIEVFDESTALVTEIGKGIQPLWSLSNSNVYSLIIEPNRLVLTGYNAINRLQILPAVNLPSQVAGYDVISNRSFLSISRQLTDVDPAPLPTLWQPILSMATSSSNRMGVVALSNVAAPYPYLLDPVDESFTALRGEIGYATGWDFLANLDSAYSPLTEPPDPGLPQNWLYTGRAIAINSLPLQAGWMVISREDYNGETYWRVYLKALKQDGSQGLPIKQNIWDLNSRYSGDPIDYELGGKTVSPPSGYWIDFTAIALRYDWQRIPAETSWRTYFMSTNFSIFVLNASLDWHTAMSQLYPPEALATYTPLLPITVSPGAGSSLTPTRTATSTP